MKGDNYLHRLDSLQERNRFLGIALIVLVAINVINAGLLFSAQSKTQTIVVPVGGEGMQIGNGKADERYVRRMSRYIINQLGTYSAATARAQFQELLQLFAPVQVTAVAAYFDKIATDVERYPSISSNVEWAGEKPLKYTTTMIQVTALKMRLVNGTVTERNPLTYCIRYHIEDARFFIDKLEERNDPVTDVCFVDSTSSKKAPDNDNKKPR